MVKEGNGLIAIIGCYNFGGKIEMLNLICLRLERRQN